MTQSRPLNYVAFVVLMVSTVLGLQFLWGLLFLFWSVQAVKTSHAFLLSTVTRFEDPLLFWLIQVAWVVFGVWMIVADLVLIF